MGSIPQTIHYCCISNGDKVLVEYNRGNPEIDFLARLCLERAPSYHACYFESFNNRMFGFLMSEGLIHFAIADEGLGKSGHLEFLEHMKENSNKVLKSGTMGSLGLTSFCINDEMMPVILRLIGSLENVSRRDGDFLSTTTQDNQMNDVDGRNNLMSSTVAPLLGKYDKASRELAEFRDNVDRGKTTDRGLMIDMSVNAEENRDGLNSNSLQKNGSSRVRTQSLSRRRWSCVAKIVLTCALVFCAILLGIWLIICRGVSCLAR